MTRWTRHNLPRAEEMEHVARAVMRDLPAPFNAHMDGVTLHVEELADRETLDSLGLPEAMMLSGVYQGVPLEHRSISDFARMPDRIRLFRRPILAEWLERGDISLQDLIAHVVIHEIGHHFGLSDEDMHTLEGEDE